MSTGVGIVVIGRNEGERLVRCLRSVIGQLPVVYVDSGSEDGSQVKARELGVDVVGLDMTTPFTAARARNRGFSRFSEIGCDVEFVQFVDGDCELDAGWIGTASMELRMNTCLAAVCGRLRERHPEASIYNTLCQIEWDGPLGDVPACGGVAMFRAAAFKAMNGFREDIQAGEEPELCFRLRAAGWSVRRLGAPMAVHDAQIQLLQQWALRARRGGQAFAQCHWLHRGSGFRTREVMRAIGWGILAPLILVVGVIASLICPWCLVPAALVLAAAMLSIMRNAMMLQRRGTKFRPAMAYGVACLASKLPEAMGVARYHLNRMAGRRGSLLEYRQVARRSEASKP